MAKTGSLDDCCIQVTKGSDTRGEEVDGTAHFRGIYDKSNVH